MCSIDDQSQFHPFDQIKEKCDTHKSSNVPILSTFFIGKFSELTQFFNDTLILFHQPKMNVNITNTQTTALVPNGKVNFGLNISTKNANLSSSLFDGTKDIVLYGAIDRSDQSGIIPSIYLKMNALKKSFVFNIEQRWAFDSMVMFRVSNKPQNRFLVHFNRQNENKNFDLTIEKIFEYSSNIQLAYIATLWETNYCRIDGGFDFRMSSRETLLDLGFRLNRWSDSLSLKFDVSRPLEAYWFGFQKHIYRNVTVGLFIEKAANHQRKSRRFGGIIRWSLTKTNLCINGLINSESQLGFSLTQKFNSMPLLIQLFCLYSWKKSQHQWGLGIKLDL